MGCKTINSPASFEFLSWLTATACLYWLLPPAMRRYLLIVSTAGILAYADPKSLLALSVMTTVVCIAMQIKGAWRNSSLLAACAAILVTLVAFKLLETTQTTPSMTDRLIPLGLSFYSLRCVHLLIERYLGQIERPATLQVIEYLFFPPTIMAGPIHRYPAYAAEQPGAFSFAMFSAGLERILYGYVKIVVIGNYLLNLQFSRWILLRFDPDTAGYQYFDALNYGLNLYFQFSGYSDIAIGFALIFGHKIMENFSWPLLQPNIVMFWRNWHISLTSLCREYVFAGVYAATRQAWAGVFLTMLAVSLWHGLTLNYLAWGLYHAAGILVCQQWSKSAAAKYLQRTLPSPVNRLIGWFLTFQFVMLGFVWTKEVDIAASFDAYMKIISGVFGSV